MTPARKLPAVLLTCAFALAPFVTFSKPEKNPASWPAITSECRPWTYWWWMGSAVEKDELKKNLETLSEAGLGGVHIIPIYGVKGHEDLYIDYLSPDWISMFELTKNKADNLGMGVDISTGTGWPFGGPQIEPEHAAKTLELKKRGSGYELKVEKTGQKVKRAAPGGHGLVMDYYCRDALGTYLSRFDRAFAGTDIRPRSFYNDSFEVYGADWTADMFHEFKKRRGYDLREHLAALDGKGDKEYVSRVLCDYRETVSDLLLNEFTRPFTEWAHEQGAITRNQAHGSPGNLLDLYAAADIPETEAFGPSHFDIPGLDYYKSLPEHHGKPDVLVMKFAGSAAHITGKPLVSSESCTWLGEHFTVSLAHVKPEIDKLWTGGINHVFYHGITYSPTYEDWPGWLFYAPVNFGPSTPWFRDLPALNDYIARTQSFLQSGAPDNDILLYWPVHDLWSGVYEKEPVKEFRGTFYSALKSLLKGNAGKFADKVQSAAVRLYESKQSKVKLFAVHNADEWLYDTSFGKTARELNESGYTFDYISDRMIADLAFDKTIKTEGGTSYRAVVVPRVRYMPVSTQEKLAELSRQGAQIVYISGFPQDVPGLAEIEKRRERLQKAIEKLDEGNVSEGNELRSMLSEAGVEREPMAEQGLSFVRRSHEAGHYYFITNLGPKMTQGWIELGARARSAMIFDPLHKKSGGAAMKSGGNRSLVYLKMAPGRSLVLKTFTNKAIKAREWQYFGPAQALLNIKGAWQVKFIKGGPSLPASYETRALESWTQRPGRKYKYFSGTARYSIEFHVPKEAASRSMLLDLGEVRESARVFINGEEAGVVFCHPYKLRVGEYLLPGSNRLAIEITNLPANRIIYLERHLKRWKKFRDINFVNVHYLPFNAATWRIFQSGLLGPVRLRPSKPYQGY